MSSCFISSSISFSIFFSISWASSSFVFFFSFNCSFLSSGFLCSVFGVIFSSGVFFVSLFFCVGSFSSLFAEIVCFSFSLKLFSFSFKNPNIVSHLLTSSGLVLLIVFSGKFFCNLLFCCFTKVFSFFIL